MSKKIVPSWLYIIVLLVVAGAGYVAYSNKYFETLSGRTYKMNVAYFSERNKKPFETQIPELVKRFKKNGLRVDINFYKAGTTTPADKVEWDFSVSNTISVLTQRSNGQKIEPLLWDDNCYANAVAIAAQNSNLTLQEFGQKNKKILVYGFGYQSGIVLRAIKEWGLEGATLYSTNDDVAALTLLKQGDYDLIISDANSHKDVKIMSTVIGRKYEEFAVKIVAQTNYQVHCRMISYSASVDKEAVEKFKKGIENFESMVWSNLVKVNMSEFDSLASEFKWDELNQINNAIKPISLNLKNDSN